MKKSNLLKLARYIKNVPQEMFDMSKYRKQKDFYKKECGSVGCVIGHATALVPNEYIPRYVISKEINFQEFSEKFTGISHYDKEWDWCFSAEWERTDNTPKGASQRIKWLLKFGLPENWAYQMERQADLCYTKIR